MSLAPFLRRYEFVEMWDFAKLAPDKLLAISKTLTGASFGFGLSKVLASFGFALTCYTQLYLSDYLSPPSVSPQPSHPTTTHT